MVAYAKYHLCMVLAVMTTFLVYSFSDIVPMHLYGLLQILPFLHRLQILHMEISREESGALCSLGICTPLV